MAYIKSDEDYNQSLGISPKEAKIQKELDRRNIDYGYCNPRKARWAQKIEDEIRKQFED